MEKIYIYLLDVTCSSVFSNVLLPAACIKGSEQLKHYSSLILCLFIRHCFFAVYFLKEFIVHKGSFKGRVGYWGP